MLRLSEMKGQPETLAKVFAGLGHPVRIILLTRLNERTVSQIAAEIGVKLPAMQRHVNNLADLGLITKTGRGYELTELGRHATRLISEFGESVPSLESLEKEQLRKHLQQGLVKYGAGLTKHDIAKLLEDVQSSEGKARKKG